MLVAETRVSSITDEILALDDSHYNTWETVTVDFGDIGSVVCDKSMVKDEGYGKYLKDRGLESSFSVLVRWC